MELQYFKTDRNGTKYYYDWQCPRCGGAGEADKWYRTGKTCYACGGTGKRAKPLIYKEYTPEYRAKLDEKARKREQERIANLPKVDPEELKRKADEARKNIWESEGLSREGKGYLYTGETYKNREKLYELGGRWNKFFSGYVCPVEVDIPGIKREEITAEDYCNETGYIDAQKAWAHFKDK